MKRREFIAATAALLVSPRRLRAQGKPRRIGWLGGFTYPPTRGRPEVRRAIDGGLKYPLQVDPAVVTYLSTLVDRYVMGDVMADGKWVSYQRVSTQRQGRSGLGLEAQRQAIADFLNGGDWKLIKEFTEVESGKKADRPQLEAALAACRLYGAKLVIAKMDRLSRNAHFLLSLRDAGVDFVAADMPNANRLTVGIMAMVAEDEGQRISERTKSALAAAKRRGIKLGGDRGVIPTTASRKRANAAKIAKATARAADLAPAIKELQASGATSLRAIADGLNQAGIPTPRGKGEWSAVQVQRTLARL